jgi:hypothetical protein
MPDAAATPPDPKPRYEPTTRSGRRLTPLRRFLYRIAVPPSMALVRFWWLTCRIVRVEGAQNVDAALAGGPAMPVYWHQHQLFVVRYLLTLRRPELRLAVGISPSVDGEIPAMLARWAGVRVLRGSSTYEGARALRDYYAALRDGDTLALTPDGPFGPRYGFKPGPVLLSQMSGRPMLPIAYAASRVFRFKTWDRFVLPLPFARIVVAVGAPRQVPRGLDAASLQRWQSEMEAELLSLYRAASASLARG